MMRRSLHRIVPTLLALGLLPAAAFGAAAPAGPAAGSTERDAHFEAVLGLIERDFRLPAQRQLADFQKAGYPESEWYGKFLAWYHADRFKTLVLDKAEQDRLAREAKSLEAELKANAAKLPPNIKDKTTGSGVVIRLVNDLLRTVSQDLVPERGGMTAEKKAALEATTKALIDATNAVFAAGLEKVKAHAKTEEDLMMEDDRSPKFLKMAQDAVEMRNDAVRPVYFAFKALREVAERGKRFGVDEGLAQNFLKEFTAKNFALLQDWDYNWGDYHPYLKAFCIDLSAQAARQKLKGSSADELANDLRKVIDMDVAKDYAKEPEVADEIRTLQAKCWGNYLAWCREMGRDVGPKWFQTGVEAFKEFKEKANKDRNFRLDHKDPERAMEVARVYFQAGRLFRAKGDETAAVGAFGAVAAVRTNPLAGNASLWLADKESSGPGASASAAWGQAPVAEDPAAAVMLGNSMRRQAESSGSPEVQRQALMTAAVALRNGVLGLSAAAYAETADEIAPELWFRYAEVLNKLGMKWHAALVSQAGLRHVESRVKELRGKNPWQDKNGEWTATGKFVSLLARNSVTYASNLLAAGRGASITQIYDDSITLVNSVSPKDGGKALDRIQIIIAVGDKDFKRGLELCDAYVKKYPEEYYDAASIRTYVYTSWLPLLKDAERKTIADKAQKEAAEVAKKAAAELPGTKDPARKKVLQQAMRDGQALEVVILLNAGENEKVLDKLDKRYWEFAPSDQDKAAQMLGHMCTALLAWYKAQASDQAKRADAKLLVASWPRIQAAYEIWKTQKARLTQQEDACLRHGAKIAYVFNVIANFQVPAMRQQPDAPPALADIGKEAGRAYADLIEPTISEAKAKENPNLPLQVGNVLWDLDEHERACRLFELYLKTLGDDPELAALRDNAKEVLAPLDAPIRARPELRARWELVVDLLWDDPELNKKILEQDLDEADWREKKKDYVQALEAIRALRAEVAKFKMALGPDFGKIDEGLAKLDGQVQILGRDIAVTAKLAFGFREQNDKAKANTLYEKLIAYDPTSPEYLAATVELTIDRLKGGEEIAKEVLEKTRVKAARYREKAQPSSPTYWTAVLQVMELSLAMKDLDLVNKRLRFDAVNASTPADDLQSRPRNPRDDRRVRRARNALAVELCKRYLAVFSQPGVTAKPSFAIVEVEIEGKATPVFVPVDAPKFVPVRRELNDGTVVVFLWEDGKTPPPEPEATPAPAAPSPATEAKPDAAKPDAAKPADAAKPEDKPADAPKPEAKP